MVAHKKDTELHMCWLAGKVELQTEMKGSFFFQHISFLRRTVFVFTEYIQMLGG